MAIKRFVTTLDDNLIKKLKVSAAKQDTSVNKLLEKMIKEYLINATIREARESGLDIVWYVKGRLA